MIPLRLIDPPDTPAYRSRIEDGTMQPGDCWQENWHDGVPGWRVILPNGAAFHTSQPASDGSYWETTGTAPGLTVMPSIWDRQPGNEWHGWIRDGQLVEA